MLFFFALGLFLVLGVPAFAFIYLGVMALLLRIRNKESAGAHSKIQQVVLCICISSLLFFVLAKLFWHWIDHSIAE